MNDWPIDRELDERLRQVVLGEVAAADPHQISFRNRPARRRSLAGAAVAVMVLVAALVWRSQSAPPVSGPSDTPAVTPPSSASASPTGTLQAGPTPGPTADPACLPGKTYACWADGPAVALADGRLLYPQAGAIFDPTTRTFTATGKTNVARGDGTGILLADGRVLIAGGEDFGSYRDTTVDEIYDPKTGRFTPIGPVAPHDHAVSVALTDGRVLILGGTYTSPAQVAADIFDPATGTFTAAGSTPRKGYVSGAAGNSISAVLLGSGKVLVLEAPYGQATRTEIYDPSANTFTPLATSSLVQGSTFLAKLPGGRVMFFGGGNTAVEAYDPTTGSFGHLAYMHDANVWTYATLTDGRILVLKMAVLSRTGSPGNPGGLFAPLPRASARPGPDNSTEPVTLDGEIYDPANDKWTELGHLNQDRNPVQLAPLPNGGAIVTGTTLGLDAVVAELFDPKTGKFTLNQ